MSAGDIDSKYGIVDLGVSGGVTATKVTADGSILIAATPGVVGVERISSISKYKADGTLDGSFGNKGVFNLSANQRVREFREVAGGTLVLFSNDDQTQYELIKLTSNGSIDTSFQKISVAPKPSQIPAPFNNQNLLTNPFVVTSDNTIVALTSGESISTYDANGKLKSNSNGVLKGSRAATVMPNGKVIASYAPPQGDDIPFDNIKKFNSDGSVVANFPKQDGSFIGTSSTIVAAKDGGFYDTAGNSRLVKYTADGAFDKTFGKNKDGRLDYGIFLDNLGSQRITPFFTPDGKIFIKGFTSSSGFSAPSLARYNADGTIDKTFGDDGIRLLSGNEVIGDITIQKDGDIITVDGDNLIRYKNDGSTPIAESKIGTDNADTLAGGSGNDVIFGRGGNDLLFGAAGNDSIDGENGNDTIVGGKGDDFLYGANGNDSLLGETGNDYLNGGNDNDTLVGGDGTDTLLGGLGNDFLYGGNDNDRLLGGAGNDYLNGGYGGDTLVGDDGVDTLFGDRGDDFLYGGNDNDDLYGGDDNDYVNGGYGDDRLRGDKGSDTLFGDLGDDYLYGDEGDDRLLGGAGNDNLDGGLGADTLVGDDGKDYLVGFEGNDFLYGGNGNDTVQGLNDNDYLNGGYGDDSLLGDFGNDTLFGDLGNDYLNGNEGDDKLFGGDGNDTLQDYSGANILNGGNGNDILFSGAVNTFSGATNTLTGGAGNDTFGGFFAGTATITDFQAGTDKISLDKTIFSALQSLNGNGFSIANEFAVVNNSSAVDSSKALIVYNTQTGNLTYNPDREVVGIGNRDEFAKLQGSPTLTANDFIIN
jgi:Ca2+-binding RTX toxin-like protein